jgi:hypothetical protein
MRIGPFALIAFGFAWLVGDIYLVIENVVLRETRLVVIAQFLDTLPRWASNSAFLCLSGILLVGWTIPLVFGFRLLLQKPQLR